MHSNVMQPLREVLQALAAPAEQQIARYPQVAVTADELALEFNDALLLLESEAIKLNGDQLAMLLALDAFLNQMSGAERAELWTSDALRSAPEWIEVREASREGLAVFGWPPDPLPPSRGVFVSGRPSR